MLNFSTFVNYASKHFFAQSLSFNLWNIFKVNDKDTRTTPLTHFWCFYWQHWTYFSRFSSISSVDLVKWRFAWTWANYSHGWKITFLEIAPLQFKASANLSFDKTKQWQNTTKTKFHRMVQNTFIVKFLIY